MTKRRMSKCQNVSSINTLTLHHSPSSVADAIRLHIAERIVAKAAEQATRAVDKEVDSSKK